MATLLKKGTAGDTGCQQLARAGAPDDSLCSFPPRPGFPEVWETALFWEPSHQSQKKQILLGLHLQPQAGTVPLPSM